MDYLVLIDYVICIVAIYLYIKENLTIIQIDKEISKFGLWKSRISFKELKTRAANTADKAQMDKYENAIKMLRVFKWLTVLLLILNIINGIFS